MTTVYQTAFLEPASWPDLSGSQSKGRALDRRGGPVGTSGGHDPSPVVTAEGLRWPTGSPTAGAEIELLGYDRQESEETLGIWNGAPCQMGRTDWGRGEMALECRR